MQPSELTTFIKKHFGSLPQDIWVCANPKGIKVFCNSFANLHTLRLKLSELGSTVSRITAFPSGHEMFVTFLPK